LILEKLIKRAEARGGADPEARVGRNGKTYELGYKLHIAVDAKSELPLAVIVASANDNEKHAPTLLEKALKVTKGGVRLLVADCYAILWAFQLCRKPIFIQVLTFVSNCKLKNSNLVDMFSNSILDGFSQRFCFLLMSIDEMGFQYYRGVNNVTMDDMLYHFNYFILLITGIYDSLALQTIG
jgi:hypothetical protein